MADFYNTRRVSRDTVFTAKDLDVNGREIMKFGYTIIYVPDVAEAVAFYERAFGLAKRFADAGGQYAEMETGTTVLAFASNSLGHTNFPQGFRETKVGDPAPEIEIAFLAEDVQKAFDDAVKNGASVLVQPETKPWGQTVSYVRDLNGVLVEIATPI